MSHPLFIIQIAHHNFYLNLFSNFFSLTFYRALERETQKEKEKNRSNFLLSAIRDKKLTNQLYSSLSSSSSLPYSNTKLSPTDSKKYENRSGTGNRKKNTICGDLGSVDSGSSKGTPRQTPKKNYKRKDVESHRNVQLETKGTRLHFFKYTIFVSINFWTS